MRTAFSAEKPGKKQHSAVAFLLLQKPRQKIAFGTKAFIFTTDALLSLVIVFTLLGLVNIAAGSLAISQNLSQKASDAAIVGLYMGKDASGLNIAGISSSPNAGASSYSCKAIVRYNSSGSLSESSFCVTGA